MARRNGQGRLSGRGILALTIGLVFVWFSFRPQSFDVTPPFFILVMMFLAGSMLCYGGISSLLFVSKRSRLVQKQAPVSAEICVLVDDDEDRGTETVHVRINGKCQALGVGRSGPVKKYIDNQVRQGEVWLDETGKVYAVALDGNHLNTLIGGRYVEASSFDKSQKLSTD